MGDVRRRLYDADQFRTYSDWFHRVMRTVTPEARARAGFAWRRDRDGESLLWCAGLEFEGIMLLRFEACALMESACGVAEATEALEMRAAAAARFAEAADLAASWKDGAVPQGVWSELTERHNRDCALLAATVTHATAVAAAGGADLEARCAALAAVHASLVAHSDAHDPQSAPCYAIALVCSVAAIDTVASNAERHLKKGDAPSAGACALRCRELVQQVSIPDDIEADIQKRMEDVLYITDRVTKERAPFHARLLAPAAELPRLY